MASRDLRVTLLGEDRTSEAFGSASGGASKFGKATMAAMAVVATAAAAAGTALFKIGSDFDKAYDTIRVGTGATGDSLGALKDDFRDVVANVPTDFASASTAIADLNTRTGQTGEPLRQLSKQMLEMTRLTGGDLSANIASVTRVFGDWSIAAEDQAGTMDYLFKVSQTTGIGIDQLSQKVVQFGAPMRQLGFEFEDSAALLGKWEKEGVNIEAVLSGMKIGLGKFSAAGKEPAEAMKEITASIKGAGSAGEANRIAIEAFGQRAGPDMAAAVREGRFDLDALMETLRGSKETILGAAADTQSFGEKWTMLKNRVLLKLEPVATRVFDAVGAAMDTFSDWWAENGPTVMSTAGSVRDAIVGAFEVVGSAVKSVVGFFREHETAAKALAVVAGAVAAAVAAAWISKATVATVNAAKSVGAWVATATASTTSATIQSRSTAQIVVGWIAASAAAAANAAKVVAGWVLMGAQAMAQGARMAAAWVIALGPIAWVIAAVAAVVAAVVANWDTIVSWTKKAWGWVTGAVGAAWEWIKGAVSAAARWVVNLFLNWTLPGLIIKHWSSIKSTFSNGVNAVIGFVRGLPGKIVGFFAGAGRWLLNAGKDLLTGLWNGIKGAGSWLWNKITGWAQGLVDGVLGFFGISSPSKVMADVGKNLMLGMGVGIDREARTAVDAATRAAAAITGAMQVSPAGLSAAATAQGMAGLSPLGRASGRLGSAASAPPATAGGVPTIRIDNYNEARRSPREIAEDLTFMARTGG